MRGKTSRPAFEVDKQGLALLLERRGKSFAVLELIQNALDEQVTKVTVSLAQTPASRGYYTLTVEDDCPEGFADLSHAYTLFAESRKKSDAGKRGRFNLGEKLVLACCRRASVATTTGTIRFEGNTRSHHRERTAAGSVFTGELRMTHAQAQEAIEAVRRVLVEPEVELWLSTATRHSFHVAPERVPTRPALKSFVETLPTEIADAEGYLRRSERQTEVRVVEPVEGEEPHLYELGIPVVPVDCPWHIDIRQKVPLNTDRDNVTPGYLRRVLASVLNEMAAEAPQEALQAPWTGEALATQRLTEEAVDAVLTARYGPKRVIRDPSDREATHLAVAQGYAVIEPRSFDKAQWEAIRSAGAALPAGQVTPSPRPYSEEGRPQRFVDPDKYTPGQARMAAFMADVARRLIHRPVQVRITADITWPFLAAYGHGDLIFNSGRLGNAWFDRDFLDEPVLSLLIHELAHEYEANHLSEAYHEALCDLGARLAKLCVKQPALFRPRRRASSGGWYVELVVRCPKCGLEHTIDATQKASAIACQFCGTVIPCMESEVETCED